ncbi:VENN motif pre-toxin domain-containing protein, partial [Escherichia coli]
ITIRYRDNQKQNLANLSRDPVHANDSISPIFDKEKEQNRLKEIGMISDIGGQVADIARTQGELNALKVAQDKYGPLQADATEEQRQAYLAKLRDTPEYKKEQEKYGTGSDMQRGIQAATAALQGLAGGNMAGALAGASAPELANIIGHHAGIDDNTAAKAIAHAILGGVTAALQGNSAAAGAIGAGTGEVIASAIAKSLYPGVDPSKLTEDQKQTVSTLATLSAGMAGGIASGDVAGAAAGAGAGKNVVENNSLSEAADYLVTGKKPEDRYRDAQQQLKEAVDEFKAKNCAGLSADACSTKMDAHRDELLAGAIEFGSDFIPVYSDIKSFAEADSALSYLAAIVGIMPGLGDTAGKAIKGAEKALKAGDLETASKLINKASDEIQAVKALDVGSYKELKDRSVVGDGLEHDHIPSFAAIRQAKENELGRKLTPAEEKKLYNNATAIEVPKDVHQAGPTYGGKNTSSQVKQDAINLCGAECRDTDALRKNMLERGYDPKLVDDAIKQLKERNSQIGVIK